MLFADLLSSRFPSGGDGLLAAFSSFKEGIDLVRTAIRIGELFVVQQLTHRI